MPLHMSPVTRLQITKFHPLPPPLWPAPRAVITYVQVTKKPPHNPEKGAHDQTGSKLSHDNACDPGKPSYDQPRDWSAI